MFPESATGMTSLKLVPAAPMLRSAVCVTRKVESGEFGIKEMVALAEFASPALAHAAAARARMRRAHEVRRFIIASAPRWSRSASQKCQVTGAEKDRKPSIAHSVAFARPERQQYVTTSGLDEQENCHLVAANSRTYKALNRSPHSHENT